MLHVIYPDTSNTTASKYCLCLSEYPCKPDNRDYTRIYETFVKAVGMEVAKVYAIEGKRGEARRIGLDRNLVEWDQKESPPDY